ncbi:MAG: hypothetical protein CL862_10700, partial [Cyanobium sp. NAT70]|nr:hypothetical protein [Cyanobium sp. NAT70]
MDLEKPMFKDLITCVRCGYPETSENINFDELGLCKACRSSEQKMKISWDIREKNLKKIFQKYKEASGDNYDCIVPISGGKDSAFQLYLLTEVYDLKPLAVTFSHNWFTETGRYNLQNILEKTNVDHLEFTPKRGLVNKLARESLFKIGDACWHCHTGVEAFPLNIACKFKIPLLIYGESVAENSGKATYLDNPEFSIDYFLKMSAKVKPDEMLCADISKKDLAPFKSPSQEEIEAVGLKRIFLGDFIFWDAERQTEFVRDYLDWKEEEVEGTYKQYKSVECIMPGVHDYAKYIKRGFGRGTDFAMQDVRAGLMTIEEANEIQKQTDPIKPKILSYYSKITGIGEHEFAATLEGQRGDAAKRNLPSAKDMTIDIDVPVNNSIQKIIDPNSSINSDNRRHLGLQVPRVFPNFGLMKQEAERILKNYDGRKYRENDDTENLHELTATQIVKRMKSQTISIEALVRSYYAQYKKVEQSVNAWIEYDFENSLLQAKLLDYASLQNKFTGDISGVPFAI